MGATRYNHARRALFNAAFFGGMLIWTFLFALLSPVLWGRLLAGRLPNETALRMLIHSYGRGVCAIVKQLVPFYVSLAVERIPKPCIITPNHQSFIDPYCIGILPIKNLVFAVRSWPFRIPLYGRMMRLAGYLNTDTLDAERLFNEAKTLLESGCTIVMYPEGSRSQNGKLGRFRAGAFRLALEANVPIVPLCLGGTGQVFPKGQCLGQEAPVHISLLEPVYPRDFSQYGEAGHLYLRRHVKAAMSRALMSQNAQSPFSMNERTRNVLTGEKP